MIERKKKDLTISEIISLTETYRIEIVYKQAKHDI